MSNRDQQRDTGITASRGVWTSVKRGLRGRCPACGEGRMFSGYLTVNAACPACGNEFYHHRADDFPQYLTIFVVAHILGSAMLVVVELWPDLPLGVHYALWPSLVIVLSLLLLPRFKGALIAYQWALRMHGFETAHSIAVDDAHEGLSIARRTAA